MIENRYTTKNEDMDILDMAEEIRSAVSEGVSVKGAMSYRKSITPGTNGGEKLMLKFTYQFFKKTSEDVVHVGDDDSDFEKYSNNPEEKGRNLLIYRLGGLEVDLGADRKTITVYEPTVSKPSTPISKTLETTVENSQIKLQL
jgi:hypothetical protein